MLFRYEDYTEGPFARDILIEKNQFNNIALDPPGLSCGSTAAIQFAGCRPLGTCDQPPPRPVPPGPGPGPLPPGVTLGPPTTSQGYSIGPQYAQYARAVQITMPASGGEFSQLIYYDDCSEGRDVMVGVSMGVFSDSPTTGTPHALLSLAGHWLGGDAHCVAKGWRSAPLQTPVSRRGGEQLWLVHWAAAGAWSTVETQGTHHFAQLPSTYQGLPGSLDNVKWSVLKTTGVPLRARLGAVPVGAQGQVFADKPEPASNISSDVTSSSCDYPAVDCIMYPPCDHGGSTRPSVTQHIADTQMPPTRSPGESISNCRNLDLRCVFAIGSQPHLIHN